MNFFLESSPRICIQIYVNESNLGQHYSISYLKRIFKVLDDMETVPASSFQPESDLDSQSCENLEIFEADKVQEKVSLAEEFSQLSG